MATTIYQYPGCSTCRKALKWLTAAGVEADVVHIVEQPPSAAQLQQAWQASGLPLKRFFNTSGQSYRGGGFKDRLPSMSEAAQLAALAADGKLIKRPLLVADQGVLVGFKEPDWAAFFESIS
ncbi:MAG: arsenate reductase family protein [Myxococcales bacterium]|nr:arsenate reductase family protein [Myxococcales bacterium]